MTQEKKFVLKYKGWHDSEAEFFEVIIGPLEEFYGGHDPECHSNILIRTKRPSAHITGEDISQDRYLKDYYHINGHYIPSLVKGNIYLFSYTGKIRMAAYAAAGFEGGELKEFRDITSGFSIRKWVKNEIESLQNKISSLESDVGYWKSQANSNSSLISSNSRELTSVKDELKIVKIANLTLKEKITDRDREINEKNGLIRDGKKMLEEKEGQMGRLEIKLDEKQEKIENLRNERDSLKENLGTTGREALGVLERERDNKINEVETLASQNGIGLRQIKNLRRRYKDLIFAEESNNRNGINEAEDNIEGIKDNMMETITIAEAQKICKKCKKIAKLELKLDQIRQQQHQQYQAQQEQPTNR